MAVITIAIWMGLLFALVKLGVFKRWYMWMKVSPAVIYITYIFIVALPMNFTAPTGAVMLLRESVQLSPAVSGMVDSVPIASGEEVEEGTVLFTIDDTPYQAEVDNLQAQIKLAKLRLDQASMLLKKKAGRVADVQEYEAQLEQLNARLGAAEYNLAHTRVLAPRTGIVPHVALEAGTQVSPGKAVMTFIDTQRFAMTGRIGQAYIRHVKPGQKVDVVLKLLPGKVIPAKVSQVVAANPAGQLTPTGLAIDTQNWSEQPFLVVLDLSENTDLPVLPAGAFGTMAIYTSDMSTLGELIRAIMLRTETWLNYL